MTSEEGALYECIEKTSQGLETAFRIPQHVSAGIMAVALAVVVVGGWLAVRRLRTLFGGWMAGRRLREAVSDHRAETHRREAYHHARMLTPVERGLKPQPQAEARASAPPAPAEAPFAPRSRWNADRILLIVIGVLLVLSALVALIVCM